MAKRPPPPTPQELDLAAKRAAKAERDEKGKFLPGNTISTSGKPAKYYDVIRFARIFSEEAVCKLVDLMRNAESEGIQLAAAEKILDRGLGKAPQTVEINVDGPAKDMTDSALRLAAQEILARLPEGATIEIEGQTKEVQVEVLPRAANDPPES